MSDYSKQLFVVGTTTSAFLSGTSGPQAPRGALDHVRATDQTTTTGGISYISLLAIPSFLDAPNNTTLLTQWRHLVNVGTKSARGLAIISATCQFLNAYTHYIPSPGVGGLRVPLDFLQTALRGGRVGRFVAAGLATLSMVPMTLLIMQPMNKELRRREEISFNALDAGDSRSAGKLSDRGFLTPSGMTPRMDLDMSADFFAKDRKEKEETTDLVRRWGRLNLIRAIAPLLGTVLAYEAL